MRGRKQNWPVEFKLRAIARMDEGCGVAALTRDSSLVSAAVAMVPVRGGDQALGPGMKHNMSGEKSAGGGPKP